MAIETLRGKIRQKAAFSSDLDPRVVILDHAWWFPEQGAASCYGWSDANYNVLTDDGQPFNREIGSYNLRGILCRISKAQP